MGGALAQSSEYNEPFVCGGDAALCQITSNICSSMLPPNFTEWDRNIEEDLRASLDKELLGIQSPLHSLHCSHAQPPDIKQEAHQLPQRDRATLCVS